jgi:hypothetical protein
MKLSCTGTTPVASASILKNDRRPRMWREMRTSEPCGTSTSLRAFESQTKILLAGRIVSKYQGYRAAIPRFEVLQL